MSIDIETTLAEITANKAHREAWHARREAQKSAPVKVAAKTGGLSSEVRAVAMAAAMAVVQKPAAPVAARPVAPAPMPKPAPPKRDPAAEHHNAAVAAAEGFAARKYGRA